MYQSKHCVDLSSSQVVSPQGISETGARLRDVDVGSSATDGWQIKWKQNKCFLTGVLHDTIKQIYIPSCSVACKQMLSSWSQFFDQDGKREDLMSEGSLFHIKQIANGSKNKSATCIIFFNASFITSWLGSVKGDTRQCHMAAACKWPPDLKYRCILAHLTSYSKPLSGVHLRSAKYSHNPVDRWHWFKQNCERRHIHSRSSWEAVISIWKPVSPGASAFL